MCNLITKHSSFSHPPIGFYNLINIDAHFFLKFFNQKTVDKNLTLLLKLMESLPQLLMFVQEFPIDLVLKRRVRRHW